MTTPLVVVGAGGFGRETLDVVAAINRGLHEPVFQVLGVIDSNPSQANLELLDRMGVSWLGTETDWLRSGTRAKYLVGIGNTSVRTRIRHVFGEVGLMAATAIHPSATVGSLSRIGAGSVICAGVQISTNVLLGEHVHVNPSATIGHDTTIDDCVSVNPGAIISGDVDVRPRALIGAGAVVLQGLTIGEAATVGASACVVRSVEAGQTVKGIPAR